MKKRVLSLLMALALCLSLLPGAALAEGDGPVEYDGTAYDTLDDALQEAMGADDPVTIYLTDDAEVGGDGDSWVYGPTTVVMNGHSLTTEGSLSTMDDLTLSGGAFTGELVVDGKGITVTVTASAGAEAAISGGLNVKDGSCTVSGAKIGVDGTLSYTGDALDISGSEQAVRLSAEATLGSRKLYGSAETDGATAAEAVFETDTYTVGGAAAKRLSSTDESGAEPPAKPELTVTPDVSSFSLVTGQSKELTVSYNGEGDIDAYIQESALASYIDLELTKTGDGEWSLIATAGADTKPGTYKLYVYSVKDSFLSKLIYITVTAAVAKDSDGNYYDNIKTAFTDAADGSTITALARVGIVYNIEVNDKTLTLDLNGKTLDEFPIVVCDTGKLTVVDSAGGGAVGAEVRSHGKLVFEPESTDTALLQLDVYGGTVELRGGCVKDWTLYNGVKLTDLIPSGEGYAYRSYNGGGSFGDWVTLTDAADNTVSGTLAVLRCEHAGFGTDGKCLYCGLTFTAKSGDKYYTTVEDALADVANVADGATITLLSDNYEELFITRPVTIDLNGYTMKNGGVVYIEEKGVLTLTGTGTAADVEIGSHRGGKGGALKVLGDGVYVDWLEVIAQPAGKGQLSAGTFEEIQIKDESLDVVAADLLADGYAFAAKNNKANVRNGYTKDLSDVTVVPHTHYGSPCACGAVCAKHDFKDGKCTLCGAWCEHPSVDENTLVCADCGLKMAVRIDTPDGEDGTVTTYAAERYSGGENDALYYALDDAPDGSRLTLLMDGIMLHGMVIGKELTLDFNGKSISDAGLSVGYMSLAGTLTLTGRNAGSDAADGSITVYGKGTLKTDGFSGKLGSLIISCVHTPGMTPTVQLDGGTFGSLTYDGDGSITLGSLLKAGYAFMTADGYLGFADALSGREPLYNVNAEVVECGNTADDDMDGTCNACGLPFAAVTFIRDGDGINRTIAWFHDLQTAIDAKGRDYGASIQLLMDAEGDYTVSSSAVFAAGENNYKFTGTVTVTGSVEAGFNGGSIKKLVVSGADARLFSTALIDTLVIEDGATWASVPYAGYGYKAHYTDSYAWFDGETLAADYDGDKLSSVTIEQLPVSSAPRPALETMVITQPTTVSVFNDIYLGVSVNGGETYTVCLRKQGETDVRRLDAKNTPYPAMTTLHQCDPISFGIDEAGVYDLWCEVSKDGYTRTSGTITLTVAANLRYADIELDQTEFTYTGAAQSPTVKSVKLYGHEVPASEYDITVPAGTNKGSYTVTAAAKAGSAYIGTASKTYKILARVLTGVDVGALSREYDGTINVTLENTAALGAAELSFTYDGGSVRLAKDRDYTISIVSYSFANADVGSGSAVLMVRLLQRRNYVFKDADGKDTYSVMFSSGIDIVPAELPVSAEPAAGSISAVSGTSAVHELDVSALLGTLPAPQRYGDTIAYSLEASDGSSLIELGSYYSSGASVDGDGLLRLPLTVPAGTPDGELGTVRVRVTTKNYKDFYITVHVSAAEPITPSGSPELSRTELTYGETLGSITLSGKLRDEENGVDVEGAFTWNDPGLIPGAGESYAAAWTFTPDEAYGGKYTPASGTSSIRVKPAQLENVSVEQTGRLFYNGKPQAPALKTSATAVNGMEVRFTYSVSEGGTYSAAIPTFVVAYTFTVYYKASADNHEDFYGSFTVTIEPKELTARVEVLGGPFTYTGSDIEPEVAVYDDETKIAAYEYTVTYTDNRNAGRATVTITDKPGGNYTVTGSTTFEIDRAASTVVTAPAPIEGLEYSGTAQALTTEGEASGGTMKYRLGETGEFTTVMPAATDAGSYTVYYMVEGDANHYDTQPASVTAAISAKTVTASIEVVGAPFTYTGGDIEPEIIVRDGGTVIPESEYTVAFKDNRSVGAATVTVTDKPGGNYTVSGSAQFAINRAGAKFTAEPKGISGLEYTGQPQDLVTTGTSADGTVKYRLGETGEFTATVPTATDAGSYTVYYMIEGDANHDSTQPASVTVTVSAKTVTASIEVTGGPFVYTGNDIVPEIVVRDGETVIPEGEYELTITDNRNAGRATVTVTDKPGGNYTVTGSTTFEIDRAASAVAAAPAPVEGLGYDSTAHALVTAGEASGGTMRYRLGETGYFTTAIPTVTDAGTYTVYYMVEGDANHYDTRPASVTVTIASAVVTVTAMDKRAQTGSRAPDLSSPTEGRDYTVSAMYGDDSLTGTITLTYVDENGAEIRPSMSRPGEVIIRAGGLTAPNGNYTVVYVDGTLTIVKRPSSGGAVNPSSPVYVEETENGSVTVDPKLAAKGDTVTVTVDPDDGYDLGDLTVTDKNGGKLELTDDGGGKYSFVMPSGSVLVKAGFTKADEVSPFDDVSPDDYYYEAVKWAAENGITGGIGGGLFGPGLNCTRAQIVTFLWRASGSPAPSGPSGFADVPEDSYYAEAVAWAVERGITTGTGGGKFSPDAVCTRAQSVTFLWRALGKPAGGDVSFADVPAGSYYEQAVAWAASSGVTTGIGGGLFGPDLDCTRAQIVTFLYRSMK